MNCCQRSVLVSIHSCSSRRRSAPGAVKDLCWCQSTAPWLCLISTRLLSKICAGVNPQRCDKLVVCVSSCQRSVLVSIHSPLVWWPRCALLSKICAGVNPQPACSCASACASPPLPCGIARSSPRAACPSAPRTRDASTFLRPPAMRPCSSSGSRRVIVAAPPSTLPARAWRASSFVGSNFPSGVNKDTRSTGLPDLLSMVPVWLSKICAGVNPQHPRTPFFSTLCCQRSGWCQSTAQVAHGHIQRRLSKIEERYQITQQLSGDNSRAGNCQRSRSVPGRSGPPLSLIESGTCTY